MEGVFFPKTKKNFPGKNIRENLHDSGVGKNFMDRMQNSVKLKKLNWTSKFKLSALSKTLLR